MPLLEGELLGSIIPESSLPISQRHKAGLGDKQRGSLNAFMSRAYKGSMLSPFLGVGVIHSLCSSYTGLL